MNTSKESHSTADNSQPDIHAEIRDLKSKLTPDGIANAIDQSYLSINNMRLFLQILALIMTVFLAGIAIFGYLGAKSFIDLRTQIRDIDDAKLVISKSITEINRLQVELTESVSATSSQLQQRTETTISNMMHKVAVTIDDLHASYKSEISDLNRRTTMNAEMVSKARELAEGIYKDNIIELFASGNFDNHSIVIDNWGHARVVFKLKYNPINGSVRIQRDGFQEGVAYFSPKNNIIIAQWANNISAEVYASNYFIVSYLPDLSSPTKSTYSFSDEGILLIDGRVDQKMAVEFKKAP